MLSAGGAWNRGADENARVELKRIARLPVFTACMLINGPLELKAKCDSFNFTSVEAKKMYMLF